MSQNYLHISSERVEITENNITIEGTRIEAEGTPVWMASVLLELLASNPQIAIAMAMIQAEELKASVRLAAESPTDSTQ